MGTKIPLINTKGNFTKVVSIITFDGTSLGGEESINPNDEKQNEASTMQSDNIRGSVTQTPAANPAKRGTVETAIPKMKDASTSPKIMAEIEMGVDTSLSNVFIRVSQGAITGLTEVAVKKRDIESIPGTRKFRATSLPM